MVGADKQSQLILAEDSAACYVRPSQPERGDGVMADDAVMEILKRIQASIVALDEKTQASLAALDKKFTTQYTILAQDARMIRVGIHDMVRTRVTAGEMDALHEDVDRLQQGLADLMARVDVLEHTKQ
jgi:hypothetical protein